MNHKSQVVGFFLVISWGSLLAASTDNDIERILSSTKSRNILGKYASQVPTQSSTAQCMEENDTAYVGSTLNKGSRRIKGVQSASACCKKCARIDECTAWTWSKRTKICYPKGGYNWRKEKRRNIVSGVVMIGPSRLPQDRKGSLIWNPTLKLGEHTLENFGKDISINDGADNKYVVRNPTCDNSNPVVRAVYEKGRWSPSQGGGVLFFAWPKGKDETLGDAVRLEYQVFFPENFPWVKGGKLPGIIGGRTGCGGGDDANDCFSVRGMWRRDGEGEVYLYSPKNKWSDKLCDTEGTKCNSKAGLSLMRGAFKFEKGKWITLAYTVIMNDIGKSNGYVRLDVDGEKVIEFDEIIYRTSKDVYPAAFTFSTWFGGSDETWSPPNTVEAYFRNFKIYQLE